MENGWEDLFESTLILLTIMGWRCRKITTEYIYIDMAKNNEYNNIILKYMSSFFTDVYKIKLKYRYVEESELIW
jgi:hypothetical protein